jgi:phage host-nuclease inhibitor protein Gam
VSYDYEFDSIEISEMGKRMAEIEGKRFELEAEKKDIAAKYKIQIDFLDNEIIALYSKINSGYETREEDLFDQKKEGAAFRNVILWILNNSLINDEKMTESKCNPRCDL